MTPSSSGPVESAGADPASSGACATPKSDRLLTGGVGRVMAGSVINSPPYLVLIAALSAVSRFRRSASPGAPASRLVLGSPPSLRSRKTTLSSSASGNSWERAHGAPYRTGLFSTTVLVRMG